MKITMLLLLSSSLLKSVMSAIKTRRKLEKKHSLHVENEHFYPIFNAGLASLIAKQQPARALLPLHWYNTCFQ